MLKVDLEKWGQTSDTLRKQALKATHLRSRERLMALYDICGGQNATRVGRQTGRHPQTVMEWVHHYNTQGPEALLYRHTGGHPPFVCPDHSRARPVCSNGPGRGYAPSAAAHRTAST